MLARAQVSRLWLVKLALQCTAVQLACLLARHTFLMRARTGLGRVYSGSVLLLLSLCSLAWLPCICKADGLAPLIAATPALVTQAAVTRRQPR